MGRFFKVSPTEVQSAFVEMPLDFMYQKLQGKQMELDDKRAGLSSLKGLLDVEVDPRYDLPTLYKKQEEYNNLIDQASRDLEMSGDINSAYRNVNDIQRKISKDDFLRYAPENYKQIKADTEAFQKGLQTGKVPEYYKNFDRYYNSGEQWKGTLDEQGNLQYYNPGPLYQEGTDIRKRAQDVMSGLRASGSDREMFQIGDNGQILSVKSGYEGIADRWVRQRANEQAEDFLFTTPEGKEFIDMQRFYNSEITPEQLLNSAADYLYQAGKNQVFSKSKSGEDITFNSTLANQQDLAKQKLMTTSELPIQNLNFVKNRIKDIKEGTEGITFSSDGAFNNMISTFIKNNKVGGTAYNLKELTAFIDSNPAYKQVFDNIMNNLAATSGPGFANLTDEQKLNAVITGYSNFTEKPIYQHNYTVAMQNAMTDRIVSDIDNRQFVDIEGDGNTKSYDDVVKELGFIGKDNKIKSKNDLINRSRIVGEVHGLPDDDGNTKSWYTYEIIDAKGKTHTYAVEADTETNSQYNGFNNLQGNLLKGNFDYFNKAMDNGNVETIGLYNSNGNIEQMSFIPSLQVNNGTMDAGGFVANRRGNTTYVVTKDGQEINYNNLNSKQRQDLIASGTLMYVNKDNLERLMEESSKNDPFRYTGSGSQMKNSDVGQ